MNTESENWKKVADRYFSRDEQAKWAEKMKDVPAGFDPEAYNRQWADLGGRIAAALPLDPASMDARKLFDEWQGDQKLPFPMEVWQFIQSVGAHRVGTGSGPVQS